MSGPFVSGVQPPSEYELAQRRAKRTARICAVVCANHSDDGIVIGELWDTTEGAMLAADIPIARNQSVNQYLQEIKKKVGRRPPPLLENVRFLIEHPGSAEDGPAVRCPQCGLRPIASERLLVAVQKYRSEGRLRDMRA